MGTPEVGSESDGNSTSASSYALIATANFMPQRSFPPKDGMKLRVNSGKPVLLRMGSMVILSQALHSTELQGRCRD